MTGQTIKEAVPNDSVFKEVLHTAADFARVGMKAEKLKEDATNFVEDGITDAKRLLKRGRYAAEDAIDDTAHYIKHDPFRSVAATFGIGFGLGAIVGLLIAYRSRGQ